MFTFARITGSLLAASASLLPHGAAWAQSTGEEPPKVQAIAAVERGGFMQTEVGFAYLVNELDGKRYGLAPMIGIFAGYDLLPILNLSAGVIGMAAGSALGEGVNTKNDLLFVSPMLRAQLAVLTTERNFVWVRAEAGFAFGLPGEVEGRAFGGNGPAFGGGVGFEHFTKLRHFSIGAHAGVLAVTQPSLGIAVTVMPTLKYTF